MKKQQTKKTPVAPTKQDCAKECKSCTTMDKMFDLEVDEELKQEQLAQFWGQWKYWIVGGIIAILATVAGTEMYHSWRMRVRLAESDAFESAVIAAYTGDTKTAEELFQNIADTGRTGYQYLAQMEIIALLFSQGYRDEAIATLERLMNDRNAPTPLRNAATISYVGNLVETGDVATLHTLLTPLLNNPAFMANATELSILLYMRNGDTEQAKKTLEKTKAHPALNPTALERLNAIGAMIE